jgi:hypothetical protein
MSRVFVAQEARLGRRVVVKVLHPDLAAGVSAQRFEREIRLAAWLQHPHDVQLLSAGDLQGLPYYTMPFVNGESLRARLSRARAARAPDPAPPRTPPSAAATARASSLATVGSCRSGRVAGFMVSHEPASPACVPGADHWRSHDWHHEACRSTTGSLHGAWDTRNGRVPYRAPHLRLCAVAVRQRAEAPRELIGDVFTRW